MTALDPRIEAVRAEYGLSSDDFWQIQQNKSWVVKHAALEVVATKAGIEWMPPQIIEASTAEGIAVLAVMGKMGDRSEWATGEASPKNNRNAYPWAMAEKRAKDRVVLKLAGIHGLVYSEDEMPNGSEDRPLNLPKAKSSAALKRDDFWPEFEREVGECATEFQLNKVASSWRETAIKDNWNDAFRAAANDKVAYQRQFIRDNAKESDDDPPNQNGMKNNSYVNNYRAG